MYLGEDPSQLVFPHTTVGFEVHEVVFEHGRPSKSPKKVESLGDLVLFVGYNSPMIFTARRFSELKGNRIYVRQLLSTIFNRAIWMSRFRHFQYGG